MVAHVVWDHGVGGSSPSILTHGALAQAVEQRLETPQVVGATPTGTTPGHPIGEGSWL